jgi:pimeloyl-ACP methyl ester carboxylesterase
VGLESLTVEAGDVRLAAVRGGPPDAPTLVFIHGYPDTKEEWDPVRERLRTDFHTVAYDVRGAGGSTAPRRAASYDFDRLADDLEAVLDALAPGKRVHLVGHDWGGLQGWEFATSDRFEGRLASFTAVAGPAVDQVTAASRGLLTHGRVLEWARRLWRSWYMLFLIPPGLPWLAWRLGPMAWRWPRVLGISGSGEKGTAYPRPTLRSDAITGAKLYRRNMPRRLRRPRVDAMAHVPVQLIIPTGDRFIPQSYYEHAEEHARSVRRRVIDAGHWVQLTHPDEVAEWIRSFVEEVERGRLR